MNPADITAMRQMLIEIERALTDEKMEWRPMGGAQMVSKGARAFDGDNGTWRILVVSFPLESGARGYDGTATFAERPTIVHLTPALSKKAYEIAEEKCR